MLLGALSGIAAAICIVLVPHREGMVAVCPPEWAVAVSPGLLIGLLLSAAVMPRLTFAACLPAMFGAVAARSERCSASTPSTAWSGRCGPCSSSSASGEPGSRPRRSPPDHASRRRRARLRAGPAGPGPKGAYSPRPRR
ncbi:hypothetical protein ACFQY7_13455 [Actinomadura luteofluorescens]|uniref:hypothetical protein n=1 Tax=Actinomadura luteofluorescens TaxID=46163 RepID=UPI003642CFB8